MYKWGTERATDGAEDRGGDKQTNRQPHPSPWISPQTDSLPLPCLVGCCLLERVSLRVQAGLKLTAVHQPHLRGTHHHTHCPASTSAPLWRKASQMTGNYRSRGLIRSEVQIK